MDCTKFTSSSTSVGSNVFPGVTPKVRHKYYLTYKYAVKTDIQAGITDFKGDSVCKMNSDYSATYRLITWDSMTIDLENSYIEINGVKYHNGESGVEINEEALFVPGEIITGDMNIVLRVCDKQ